MTITTHCPGCNAPLQIEEHTTAVTCHFCGTHFEVNTDSVEPTFRKTGSSSDSQPEVEPAESGTPATEPASYLYNPPISGQTEAPSGAELYNPPILPPPEVPPVPGEPVPPPFYTPPARSPILSGARPWIILGVVLVAAFCMTCLCLALFAFQIVQ